MNENLLIHPFDLELSDNFALDLFAEELPEQLNYVSDCASTASSLSTAGTCWGSFSTLGSIISCG